MSMRYPNGGFITASYNPVLIPGAPTIGTALAGDAQVSVAFTAPTDIGGSAITSYQVVSTPGGFTATGSASPLTVTGLSNGTAYTFRVAAINSYGAGTLSAASASVTPTAAGQQEYTTAGTYTWVAPAGVTSVSVVCVGGGGGGSAAAGVDSDAVGTNGGTGGVGTSSSITGTALFYAGGGGGGTVPAGISGLGGTGGGGNGTNSNVVGGSGAANTGGGGGGAGQGPAPTYAAANGGAGGSGVVIISSPVAAASTTGSPTVTTVGANTVYQFNNSGSITF